MPILVTLQKKSSEKIDDSFNNAFLGLDDRLQMKNESSKEEADLLMTEVIHESSRYLGEDSEKRILQLKNTVKGFITEIENYKIRLTAACLIQDEHIITDDSQFEKITSSSTIEKISYKGRILSRRDNNGKIKISKDIKWTTFLMVDYHYGNKLENLITDTREKVIQSYKEILLNQDLNLDKEKIEELVNTFSTNYYLKIDENWKGFSSKNTWAEANFDHMPYAACMPVFEKFKSDALSGEFLIARDLKKIILNKKLNNNKRYIPIVFPKNIVAKQGGIFEAEIKLGYIAGDVAMYSDTKVDGRRVSTDKAGTSLFRETTNNLGKKTKEVEMTVYNPLTGESINLSTTFEYIVIE